MGSDHESDVVGERSRRILGLFRRGDDETSAGLPIEQHAPAENSDVVTAQDETLPAADAFAVSSGMAAPEPTHDKVAARRLVEARVTADNLVAQGQTELMHARAEAAAIQAEVRERLVEVIRREVAVDGMRSTARDEGGPRTIGEAKRQAAEIISNARTTAIGLLEEAQQLLAASRLQASSLPGCEHCGAPYPPEPHAEPRPDEPVVVIDLTNDERASRYTRQSASLPKIGDEAGNTLANMRRLREASKNPDR